MKYLLILPLIIFSWLVASRVLIAKHIECYTQYGACSEPLMAPAEKLMDTPLLLPISTSSVEQAYRSMTSVKSVNIIRRLPTTLVVNLELRSPIGLVGPSLTGEAASLVDSDGVVLGASTDTKSPLLIVSDFSPTTKSISQNYVLALKILQTVSDLTPAQIIGTLDGSQLTATYASGPKIIVDIGDNASKWHFPLQQILERSRITSKSPSKIDLRFTNPVLTY